MEFVDTAYDKRYENRNESRRKLFNPDKSYLIYWVSKYTVEGIGIQYKRQMAIFRDFNSKTNDFIWVWGIGIDYNIKDGIIYMPCITPRNQRVFAHMHNDKATVFELTDAEVEKHVLMEMF